MHALLAAVAATATPAVQTCPVNPLDAVCAWIQARFGDRNVLGPLAQQVLDGVVVFVLVLIAGRVLRRVVVDRVERAGNPQVRTLTHNVITVLTWVFAVIGGLVAAEGLDAVYVFTFGGVFSLAVGLAFQDLLRNILAGIFILLEKPFRIGDQIAIGEQEGVVQTIALRTTALRTADGRLALLPNLTVFSSVILNSTAFDQRRYSLRLQIDPGSDAGAVMETARRALAATPGIAADPPPSVLPQIDADGSHVVVVSYWVDYRAHDPDTVGGDLISRIWPLSAADPANATTREKDRGVPPGVMQA